MNTFEINEYIDYSKLFDALEQESRETMLDVIVNGEQYARSYDKILSFYDKKRYGLAVDPGECSFTDEDIIFVFSEEYQTANESNNQNEYVLVRIIYSRKDECFEDYEEEQG